MIYENDEIDIAVNEHSEFWGEANVRRLIEQCIEEMAELTVELARFRRTEWDPRHGHGDQERIALRIEAEMADVLICFEFLGRALYIRRETMDGHVADRADSLRGKLRALAERRESKA